MVRRVRILSVVFGIAVLIVSHSFLQGRAPAFGQEVTKDAKAALKERDSLREQARRLLAAGKLSQAIDAAEAMLAIERRVLPAGHEDIIGSLDSLGRMYVLRGDFAAAKAARVEVLEIVQKGNGEAHWKVTDARLELEDVDRRAGITHEQNQTLAEADRVSREFVALYGAGKYTEALRPARRALELIREVLGERNPRYATSLNNLFVLLYSEGNYAAARPYCEKALTIEKEVLGERHPSYIKTLNNLAALLTAQGDYAAARPIYEKALALFKEVVGERNSDYILSLNNLAELLRIHGDYAEARPLYEKALLVGREVLGERHPLYATILGNLALSLDSQGDYVGARPLCEKALAIRKEVLGERHPEYIASLNNLAGLLTLQGDYAAARRLSEEALTIEKDVLGERHPLYAKTLNNLAQLLESQGDYAAARPLYENALALHKEMLGERHPDYAASLDNLAGLVFSQGDYAAARLLCEKALAIRKEVLGERHPDYLISLRGLAELLRTQRDYAAARPLYEKALAIGKDVLGERHPEYATSLNGLAHLLSSQGDYAAARPLYEKAAAIRKGILGERHPDYAGSLNSLGFVLWAQRDTAGAAGLLKQAIEVVEGNLDLAAAGQSERQQLAMAQRLRWKLDAYLSLAPMAKLSPGEAYRHVLASKGAVFERQRRLRAQRRRLQIDPQSHAAQRLAEYEITVKKLATLALATPDLKQAGAWRDAVAKLSKLKDELESELARQDAGFRVQQAEASRTPEQFQAALPPRTAIVDLLVYTAFQPPDQGKREFQGKRHVVAFVVRPDRPIARIDLGPFAPILTAIDEWRPILIGGKTAPAANDPAQTLRRLIWEPVESHLDGTTSVLVSPDGALGQIPLAALPGKEPNSYLIEERSIAVVPVPRMLGATAERTRNGDVTGDTAASSLLAGDINYGGEAGTGGELALKRSAATPSRSGLLADFKTLPETRIEILAVRDSFEERFPDARADVLRGDKATEEAIRQRAPKSRYLHLATHGYFAPPELRSALGPGDNKAARPGVDLLGGSSVAGYHPGLLSGIALAGANIRPTPIGHDDGILTALEVAELDLSSVELAVLSACETGLGEVAGGEGLLGLQRAFQVAGAHSVVASLWKVGDEPTRALMARFYENLWRKGQPPAQALRGAQLSMLRGDLGRGTLIREADGPKSDRLPPSYWAAFVLSTDRP